MNNTTTRLWIALFVALVFVCGLSLGIAASAWFGPRPDAGRFRGPFRPDGRRGPPAFISERIIDRLERDPDFTDGQRERLEALFAERQQQFHEFNREMRDRFETERASLHDDIADILTPTQMELFDAARRRGRMGRGPDREPR